METITSKDWFALDGVSCDSVGLYCDTPPIQSMAERRGELYTVGEDESMYKDDNSFSDISFRFTCYAFFPETFDTSAVYAFLQDKKRLTMSRNEGFYYRIRTISCAATEKADGHRIKYSITVKCAPFRYIPQDEPIVISGAGGVQNTGTRYCKPIYRITLSDYNGSGNIIVNGQMMTITIPSSYYLSDKTIIIDSEKQMAYGTSGQNLTMYTAGIFRFFAVGYNSVMLGGICSSVSITLNERCY